MVVRQQRRRDTRRRHAIWATLAAVAVVLAAGLTGWVVEHCPQRTTPPRAAAASACAATEGRFRTYRDALFRPQPAEGGAGLSDEELVRIGKGVGLTDAAFADCVRGDTYHGWVRRVTEAAAAAG